MLRYVVFSVLALGGLAAFSCSPETSEADGATTTATTGTNTSTVAGSTGAFIGGCTPECVAPQFCSVASTCIDPGTCIQDGDCDMGFECDPATNACKPGGGCGSFEAEITPVPPNLLLVLDRSCSMTGAAGGGMNKWQVAVAAINNLTMSYAGRIRFGLTMFPDLEAPSCGQGAIPIPPGPGNEMAIQTLLTNALAGNDPNFPDGPCVTNIDTAMQQASMEPALTDMTRDNFAVLISDGGQSGCNLAGGDAGTEMIIGDMFAADIPTFVIGFGSGVEPGPLNTFAIAGGVPQAGMTKYYDASDQASLDMALDTIADATIGCSFALTDTPPNPDDIFVFFDEVSLPRDPAHTSGWDYDPATNTVTFYGTSCEDLKNGVVTDVAVVFGCNVLPE